MNRVQGKKVLITGASSGMGEAIARIFASQNASLIIIARRGEKLENLKMELEKQTNEKIIVKVLDVRDREGVFNFAKELAQQDFVPDIVVNNAGLARGAKKIQEGNPDDWDLVFDVNVKGVLNILRAFLPYMVRLNRGHIINIGSIGGHFVLPGSNVYNASKFALRAISEATNLDLLGTNLRVSSVDPGMVATDFWTSRYPEDEKKARDSLAGFDPLLAEDIAEAVLFVANRPEHVNIFNMIMFPTAQRSMYFCYRKEE